MTNNAARSEGGFVWSHAKIQHFDWPEENEETRCADGRQRS